MRTLHAWIVAMRRADPESWVAMSLAVAAIVMGHLLIADWLR